LDAGGVRPTMSVPMALIQKINVKSFSSM